MADQKSHPGDAHDPIKDMEDRIAELERAVGYNQMKIDFYEKFIEIASKEVGEDLKKKYASSAMSGSSKTKTTRSGK